MIKSTIQAAALCLVASVLASCSVAQMPMRMLQAMGRTLKMADNHPSKAVSPLHIQQRELEDNRVPTQLNTTPAEAKVESRVAAGSQTDSTTENPS